MSGGTRVDIHFMLAQEGSQPPSDLPSSDDDLVSTHMSPIVKTISKDAMILAAARVMCNEGIHRLVVIDDQRRPIGIVSTLDLVASIVAAIEE